MGCEELLRQLGRDYPELRFRQGRRFAFRMSRRGQADTERWKESGGRKAERKTVQGWGTVYYEKIGNDCIDDDKYWKMQILHEVGHGLLGHRDWGKVDLERVKMESMAWAKAKELAGKYGVEYEEEFAEGEMDTYREWLHQRSRCRRCGLTRYQTENGEYHCPRCEEFGAR